MSHASASKRDDHGHDGDNDSDRDGGMLGWLAVLGTFCTWFAWIGTVKGLAVMLPTLQEQFDTQTWLVGWMITIIDSAIDLAGPFAPLVSRKLGVRTVVVLSGVMVGGSFVVSSLVSSLGLMTLVLAGVAAPAIGVSNIVTRDMIGRCFTKRHTLAFGIGATGGSLAFVVFAPLTQFFLDVYGWRGALMLMGSILLHMSVCGALLRVRPETYGSTNVVYSQVHVESAADEDCQEVPSFCSSIKNSLKLDLLSSTGYWLMVIISTLTTTMCTAWLVFFAPHTYQSKGFTLKDTTTFVTVFGVGKIIGNLLVGLCERIKAVGSRAWMVLGVLGSSVCFLLDPWLMSYWAIMGYVFLYGIFHSFIYTLLDVITKEAIGVERLGCAIGWIGLKSGIARGLISFFPGLVYDTLGSYSLAFYLMSGINALAIPAVIGIGWTHSGD